MVSKSEIHLLILGGFPRSGTRQFTDILNQHGDIEIKGEFFAKAFHKLANAFEEADKQHRGWWSEEKYQSWRLHSVLNAYAGISKGSNKPYSFNSGKLFGFKTPRIEIHRESLEKLFHGIHHKIIFFYCVRNIKENCLSEISTFDISIERYVEQTTRSLKSILQMFKSPVYATHILYLDDFISSENKSYWLKKNIFDILPLDTLNSNDCGNFLEISPNRNSTKAKGRSRREELTNEELDYMKGHRSFRATVSEFEKATSMNIWNL